MNRGERKNHRGGYVDETDLSGDGQGVINGPDQGLGGGGGGREKR